MANARDAVIGFGRQTAKGTPLAVPKFEIAMGTGHAAAAQNVEELPWTNDSQDPVGHFVSLIGGEVALQGLPVLPISSAALWYAVLGALATSGAGPYTHAASPADTLPWWTFFYAEPGGDFITVPDVKIGELVLNLAPGQPALIDINGTGGEPTYSDSKWGAATVVEEVDPFFTNIGRTLLLEPDDTPAATQIGSIQAGTITVSRNIDPKQTDDISYYDQLEQKRDISVEFPDVIFENNDFRRTVLTGSPSGTAISQQPTYGSAKITLIGSDGAAAATRSLELAFPRLKWAVEPIDADPNGTTLAYALAGMASKPSSGSVMTATTKNGNAGAAY